MLQRFDIEKDEGYISRVKQHINETYKGTGDYLLHDHGKLFTNGDVNEPKVKKFDDYIINIEYDR